MNNKSKYKSVSEWNKAKPRDYASARRQGLLAFICEYYGWKINKPRGYWDSKENVIAEAKKYNTKTEWRKNSSRSYHSSWKNGWDDECTAHMITTFKPNGYWNIKENVMAEAKKYKSRAEWTKNSMSSYRNALDNEWIDECTAHMIEARKPRGYWNIKENVLAEAKKYNIRNEWNKNSSASYRNALKNKWIDECAKHMK
jgi:hypothetical protein